MTLHVEDLRVEKAGRIICLIPKLDLAAGERLAVRGPNGSGKTTFLRVLGGLERKFLGTCRTAVPLRRRVYVHQSPYLFRGTVLFNVAYGLASRKLRREARLSTARHWLTALGVGHLAKRNVQRLSGGERRRVALARAFAVEPELLLLDEPLADLDPAGIEIVCRAITETSATVIIATPIPLPDTLDVGTYDLAPPD